MTRSAPPPTATTLDPEQITRLRMALGRISRRLRVTAAGAGLTATELSVLATLVRDGPLRVTELAGVEDVNPTMLSRVVGRLESVGLLARVADPVDRRAALLDVTGAGRERVAQLRAERSEALADRLARLPAGQVAALARALPALEALAEALRERAPGPTRRPVAAASHRAGR